MEAKELRINNYITDNFGDTFKISGVTESGICIDGFGEAEMTGMNALMSLSIDNFKPIPLTEEWLLKFGFIEDSIGYWYGNDMTSYDFVDREDKGFMLVVAQCEHKDTYIKHVHQLQNLYFALIGEELTIKE